MTTTAFPLARDTRSTLIGVVGFAVALALASQVAIPIPHTAVPITLQPLVVVLAGMFLGPLAGAGSMVLYLMAGAVGLPVFAPMGAPGLARFIGPTGGYLLAYPLGALVAGALSAHARRWSTRTLAAVAGIAGIYLGGLAQLTLLTGDLSRAVAAGVIPFALLDLGKAALAGVIVSGAARRSRD